MKRIGMIAAVLGVVGAMSAGTAGASGSKPCTAGFTESRSASQLTVSGDTCANARKVARRVLAIVPTGCLKILDHQGRVGFRKPCVKLSYTCTAVSVDSRRALKVSCTRGSRQIRFRY
ncbi:MAG TPA: hypothetical protein VNT03_10670 [Baekduia sp.]|nr:hypothetical protein [Baekduia sp.]